MNKSTGNQSPEKSINGKSLTLVTFGAGCLTFIMAGMALGGGLLLDTSMETFPRWTLIFLAGSAPFTLGGVYWIVKRTLRRMKSVVEKKIVENNAVDDAE